MGVQLFGGRFKRCVDENKEVVNITLVKNESECIAGNYTWFNPKVNFDDAMVAYLALFQVVSIHNHLLLTSVVLLTLQCNTTYTLLPHTHVVNSQTTNER